jgi:predicted DNA-binding transcriptional regulator YafY
MPRSDRLFRLLHVLRTLPAPVTAERLAEETEVSVRSIYRDIAALRAAGARIEGAAGYGYALSEDPALPPQSFTRIEIEALLFGMAEARFTGDRQIAEAAESVITKITATLPERQQREAAHAVHYVQRYGRGDQARPDVSVIRQACWDEEVLHLGYRDAEGRATDREIRPLTIGFMDNTLMCLGWCLLRDDYRLFRIDRIDSAMATGESFRPHRVALPRGFAARVRTRQGSAA